MSEKVGTAEDFAAMFGREPQPEPAGGTAQPQPQVGDDDADADASERDASSRHLEADPEQQHAALIAGLLITPRDDRRFLERLHGVEREERDEEGDAA